MVFFKDYTYPSFQLKYLIVGTKSSTVETKFLVEDSFVGRYVDPWPQLRNMLHMRIWTSEYDHKSNKASKAWYLEKRNPQRTDIVSTHSNLGRRMILKELRCGDNIVLEGGLPISGVPYEEVIPNSIELTGLDDKRERFLPRTCECMFAAFHHLKEKNNGNMRVFFNEWIQFWCKKDRKYELAPSRKEKKSRRVSSTHNPTGEIPTEINTWSSTQEMVFFKLGTKHQKYETYLTTFLSCWFCAFVFPSEEGNFIRPETFKIASLMASGNRWTFSSTNGGISGEGTAKYFDKDEARKRVPRGENIVWNATMLTRPHPTYYIDDGKTPELELAYFMSLRFNYLPLKRGGSFVIKPYSPHRFSHQFGFHEDFPGYLENDIRVESVDEGLRYWRICISRATMYKATFPPAVTSAKKLYTTKYSSWWERSYGMVLEDNLDVMVEKAGSEFVTLLEDKSQDIEKTLSKVKTPLAPQHQSKKLNSSKVSKKEVVHTSTDKEKCPQFLFSSKWDLQETSKTSKDRCWKRQRVEPSGVEIVDLRVVEVQSVNSPSRSMTI
ncbi:hypothetical protein H5410_041422 [Solanum commersonii]|uniref:Aminotransferase-like plant mobile domain-containing protein n=1 Tax=Solanum commersonii TaxID=4109 RepID=A0A9J5XUH4_SOLCO|nr:hypothetical protein H5410_041422 [Solanum commersonii]